MTPSKLFTLVIGILIVGSLGIAGFIYYYNRGSFGGAPGPEKDISVSTFLPFGNISKNNGSAGNQDGSGGEISSNTNISEEGGQILQGTPLKQLVATPVSGFTSFAKGSSTLVRYVDGEKGHVYELDLAQEQLVQKKITNTTIPKIKESFFVRKGEGVLLRYVSEFDAIQTFSAQIKKSSSTSDLGDLVGAFLPENISAITPSPRGDQVFYLSSGSGAIGTVANSDGTKKSQVFDSTLSEWNASWVSDKVILVQSKPSAIAQGIIYSMNPSTGALTKLLGGEYALQGLLSPDSSKMLVSMLRNKKPNLYLYDIPGTSLVELGLETLPEKCTWNTASVTIYCAVPKSIPTSNNGYPDTWYQGLISFNDSIWSIQAKSSEITFIADLESLSRLPFDVATIASSPTEEFIFLKNKRDGSLWSLSLKK